MKKIFLSLTAMAGLLISCPQPNGSSHKSNPVVPVQKALVVFDNTFGLCTALVYDDYRRRDEDKIAEIPAGQRSQEIEWPAGPSMPFYFAYVINLNGVSGFTMNFVPKNGKDQKSVRVDANTTNSVIIPKLDETFSTDQLLSPRSFLLLQNASNSSFELHRGYASIKPDNADTPIVLKNERAFYTIDPGAVVNYKLLVMPDYKQFPSTPDSFVPGVFYSYTYKNDITYDKEIPIRIENIETQTYTITFNANGASGTTPAEKTVNAGSVIILPNEGGLSQAGQSFGGWNASATGGEINYGAGASYLATGDITLYATWYPYGTVTHAVTFNSNGGSMTASQNVVSNTAAFRPLNPVRNGYAFVDWYGDSAYTSVYDFSKPVSGSVNLYAKWEAVLCTVTFNANGGSGLVPPAQTVNAGFVVTLPNGAPQGGGGLSKAGHVFGGWSTDDSGAENIYSPGAFYRPGSDITLFAKWDLLPYTVTFNSNGGNAVQNQTVYYGSKAVRPEDPVKIGYIFVNWYSDSNLTNEFDFSSPVTGNMTLYAKYTFEWFRIIFLEFNKQYSDTINSGESHYYRFSVTSGKSYSFTSSVAAVVRYEDGDAVWFSLSSGSVNQTAGKSGWAYIKIDNPGAYTLQIRD